MRSRNQGHHGRSPRRNRLTNGVSTPYLPKWSGHSDCTPCGASPAPLIEEAAMPASATPREVFDRLLRGVTGRQWDTLPDLYAEDTVVEHPMALPVPTRLEGREAIRQHFAAARGLPLILEG